MTAVDEKLKDEPWLVNQDPYGEGWILRITAVNTNELPELLDCEAYRQLVGDA